MRLTTEQVFNELTGTDTKEILLIRCADLLNQVSEFRDNITLPRVRMRINISLEIVGRNPPTIDISDELTVRMQDQAQLSLPITRDLTAEISTDTDTPQGQAPDQVRAEHGLPVMTPKRGPYGVEDVPVVHDDQIKYAFNATQDYGPMRGRTGNEGPVVGGGVISNKNGGGGSAEVSPDFSRVRGSYVDKYDQNDVNGQK